MAGLDSDQATKAIKALYAWLKKEKKGGKGGLFDGEDGDDFFHLTVSLKKTQPVRKDKPIGIRISHPLYDLEDAESCLIVKDIAGEGKKAAKAKIQEGSILGVTKVLRVSNLKKKFATHEQKRQLCRDYSLFLADTRILPLLPKLLGKTFFKKKKQPVPVVLKVRALARAPRPLSRVSPPLSGQFPSVLAHLQTDSLTSRFPISLGACPNSRAHVFIIIIIITAIFGLSREVAPSGRRT